MRFWKRRGNSLKNTPTGFSGGTAPRKFVDPTYPDGGLYVGESLYDYHKRKWNELDVDLRNRCIDAAVDLVNDLDPVARQELRAMIANDPEYWSAEHHFFWGMSARNYLRGPGGIKDGSLPTDNWDDYYVAAVEAALERT